MRAANTTPMLKYLKLYEENPRSAIFAPLAETYRLSGMVDDAIRLIFQGLRFHPRSITAHVVLANCYFDKGDVQKSLETLLPFQHFLDHVKLQKLLAKCFEHLGDIRQALQTYKGLQFLHPHDQFFQKKVKELEAYDGAFIGNLSSSEDSYADWEEWMPVHADGMQLSKDDSGAEDSKIEEQFEDLSNEEEAPPLGKEQEKEESEEVVEVSYEESPPEFKLGPPRGASEESYHSGEDGKAFPWATTTLAEIYYRQNHPEKALSVVEACLKTNPQDEKSLSLREKILSSSSFSAPSRESGQNSHKDLGDRYQKFLHALKERAKLKQFV